MCIKSVVSPTNLRQSRGCPHLWGPPQVIGLGCFDVVVVGLDGVVCLLGDLGGLIVFFFVVYLILFSLFIFNLLFSLSEAENGGGVCVRIRGKKGLSGVFDV